MNKPVAWINLEAWESGKYPPDDCFSGEEFTGSIPLYTHPVKEHTTTLMKSREKIFSNEYHPVKELNRMSVYELAIDSGFMLSTQYGEAEHKLMPVSDGDTLVKFAKAILRKAQEK